MRILLFAIDCFEFPHHHRRQLGETASRNEDPTLKDLSRRFPDHAREHVGPSRKVPTKTSTRDNGRPDVSFLRHLCSPCSKGVSRQKSSCRVSEQRLRTRYGSLAS